MRETDNEIHNEEEKKEKNRDMNLYKLYLLKMIFRRRLIIIIKRDANKNVD